MIVLELSDDKARALLEHLGTCRGVPSFGCGSPATRFSDTLARHVCDECIAEMNEQDNAPEHPLADVMRAVDTQLGSAK